MQQLANESGIQSNGFMTQEARESKAPNGYNIFFNEDKAGRFKPRAVLVDTEPLACESILNGGHKKLYNHN